MTKSPKPSGMREYALSASVDVYEYESIGEGLFVLS